MRIFSGDSRRPEIYGSQAARQTYVREALRPDGWAHYHPEDDVLCPLDHYNPGAGAMMLCTGFLLTALPGVEVLVRLYRPQFIAERRRTPRPEIDCGKVLCRKCDGWLQLSIRPLTTEEQP